LCLDLACMLIGQRAVAAGIGVDLGSVQRHRAHLQHADLARQQQNLDEQRLAISWRKRRRNGAIVSWSGWSFAAMACGGIHEGANRRYDSLTEPAWR
jgi:hypothetical protein